MSDVSAQDDGAPKAARIVGIVLNWRDATSTKDCVRSLLDHDQVQHVIVVDNESTGELRELRGDRVSLVEEPRHLGFSGGVNIGLREAMAGEYDAAFVINNDAIAERACVSELVRAWNLRPESIGLIAPTILNPDGSIQSIGGRLSPLSASTTDLVADSRLDYVTWASVLVPMRTLDIVGYLDEAFFMYWEDVDYGLRVADAGLNILVVSSAIVVHEKSKTHHSAGVAIDRYGAHGLVVLAHRRGGTLLYIGMPVRVCSRVFRRLISRRPDRARAVVQGVRSGWKSARGDRQPS